MSGDRIEGYLDQLLLELRGRATDVRRVLAETEEHLRDATADGVAAGLAPDEAEAQAITRFGSPRAVARRFAPPRLRLPRPALAEMASALVLLLAVGLLAIGASGLLSVAFRATLGDRFVAADLPGVTYTAARCRDFEEYHPEQPTATGPPPPTTPTRSRATGSPPACSAPSCWPAGGSSGAAIATSSRWPGCPTRWCRSSG